MKRITMIDNDRLYKNDKGEFIYITHDRYGNTSPRKFNHFGTFITLDEEFESPDEHDFTTWEEMLKFFNSTFEDSFSTVREKALRKGYVMIPVWKWYAYGTLLYQMSMEYPFEERNRRSGIAGFIYASKKDIREHFGIKKVTRNIIKKVYDIFEKEINDYNQYVNGNVFMCEIYSKYGEFNTCEFNIYGLSIEDNKLNERVGELVEEVYCNSQEIEKTIERIGKEKLIDDVFYDVSVLQDAPEKLKDDIEVVLTAIESDSDAIQYVSDNFKKLFNKFSTMRYSLLVS